MHLRVSMCVCGGGEEGVSGVGVVMVVIVRVCWHRARTHHTISILHALCLNPKKGGTYKKGDTQIQIKTTAADFIAKISIANSDFELTFQW